LAYLLVAFGQPLILNAITKLASEYLPAEKRPEAISYGSAGIFGGMLLGLGLGPALASSGDFHTLLVVNAAYGLVALVVLLAALRAPGMGEDVDTLATGGLRAVWNDRLIRNLAGVSFLGFGVFVAVTTWLQALLSPSGVSSDTAGGLLVAMVIVGILGSASVPAFVARRGQTFRLLRATALGTCFACLLLATVDWLPGFAVAVAIIGFFLVTSLPVLLEITERRAGANGGSATALMWMAGQGGGIVIAVIIQVVVHHPTLAFVLMALAATGALPLINAASRYAQAEVAQELPASGAVVAYDG
jgi:predicted MFS family arabinose efflux permease